jgi:hypothetical protein
MTHGSIDWIPFIITKQNLGSTYGTSIGLSVKPSISGIIVLSLALVAHLEVFHGCFRSIIRNIFYDRISGAAVGAIDKRILETTVIRIEKFPKAVFAYSYIR